MTRCVGHHVNADEENPTIAEVGYLCFDCFGWLRDQLGKLPAVANWLEVFIAAGGNPGAEKVGGTRDDPIPLRQDVLDLVGPDSRHYVTGQTQPVFLLWEDGVVIGAFDTWAEAAEACHAEMRAAGVSRAAADLNRLNAPTDAYSPDILAELAVARTRWQIRPTERGGGDQRGEDSMVATLFAWSRLVEAEGEFSDWPAGATVRAFAGYLSGHLSWVVEQPWVEELIVDVRNLSRLAHRLAPWRAEIRHDSTPCTACGVKAVVLHIAEGKSRCEPRMGGCGRSAPLNDYFLNATLPGTRRTG